MMLILHNNHDIKRDFEHLIEIGYGSDYGYIKSIDQYNNTGLLFVTDFQSDNNSVKGDLYKDGDLINSSSIDLNNIFIGSKDNRRRLNVAIKHIIMDFFQLKEKLQWGILTGIRPMKIIHKLLDEKYNYDEIRDILVKGYLIHSEKAELMIKISGLQREILKKNRGKISLYINIPFCPSRCSYCSFSTIINPNKDLLKKYLDVLKYELIETLKLIDKNKLQSVYIGGGTPSYISIEDMESIVNLIKIKGFNIKELTVEAGRVDTLDYKYLRALKDLGVDRLSINPQTMSDNTLNLVNREHTRSDIIKIFNIAKSLDFKSINMDLIIGLPGENVEVLKGTLSEIQKLDPDNLTVHSLAIKTNSNLNKNDLIDFNETVKMMKLIEEFTEKEGYKPYYLYRQKNISGNLENIGYFKRHIGEYNISMMEERETILAVGLGGVSKIYLGDGKIKRVPNYKGINHYINGVDKQLDKKRRYLKK